MLLVCMVVLDVALHVHSKVALFYSMWTASWQI